MSAKRWTVVAVVLTAAVSGAGVAVAQDEDPDLPPPAPGEDVVTAPATDDPSGPKVQIYEVDCVEVNLPADAKCVVNASAEPEGEAPPLSEQSTEAQAAGCEALGANFAESGACADVVEAAASGEEPELGPDVADEARE